MDEAKVIAAAELLELTKRILLATGASEENAGTVADHLVLSNLSGVDTHGVWQLPGYIRAIKAGDIVPAAVPVVVRESPTSVLVRGHWSFGHVAAQLAMDIALEKANQNGVAVAAVVECHHIGRLGHYAEAAAARNAISFIMVGGLGRETPAAVPYGGRKAVLHTNPFAMGFPGKEGAPMVFDFATTGVSGVKVINAQRRGYLLPDGLVVDKNGNPTRDPQAYLDGGAMKAFGGHKGYAVMLAAEFLGQTFTTSETFADPARGGPIMRGHGTTMVVFRADLFQPLENYRHEAHKLQEQIRETPPASGFTEVLVPGDPERRAREKRRREGIPVEADVWEQIVEIARSLDLPIETPDSQPVSPSYPEA